MVPQGFYKTLMKHMPEAKQVAAALESGHRGPMWDVGDEKWTQYRPRDVDDKDKRMRALVKKMAEAEHPITHVSSCSRVDLRESSFVCDGAQGKHKQNLPLAVNVWGSGTDNGVKRFYVPHERVLPEAPKPSKADIKWFHQLETVAGRREALLDFKTDRKGKEERAKKARKAKREHAKARAKREREKEAKKKADAKRMTNAADIKMQLGSTVVLPEGIGAA